ncbi:MAG: hypothetical protein RDV41_00335 [Planctomycetota bacterium]|nr:hypothetical protein [Planctomycetota bacterium]
MREFWKGPTRADFVAVVVLLGLAAVLSVPLVLCSYSYSGKTSCMGNLKQLGSYLHLYASKYGSATEYPPTNSTPNFLDYLRQMPGPGSALAARQDGLFVCPVAGTAPSPTALDYRYPGPSRVIDETCGMHEPIACDHPHNHGENQINVLIHDGSVVDVTPAHSLWTSCADLGSNAWMQGPPSPRSQWSLKELERQKTLRYVYLGAIFLVGLIVGILLLRRAMARENRGPGRE